ncbi:MAG: hypothetical protein JST17_09330 [Bacteroidetes bacterium]|nr:hypothetical protein [Bacteroidota bacterium]MBS1931158.1 hypothetical protein [Bacteroidota bacterium]
MQIKFKIFFVILFFLPVISQAQNISSSNQKLVLTCPFEHGSGREPREAFTWDPPDQKVIMISRVDSIIRSCSSATVVKVEPAEDSTCEIVININNLYFWYHGLIKPVVKRGQVVTAGQSLGIYTFGTELEFRMYDDEDMKDPRALLDCKVPKAGD